MQLQGKLKYRLIIDKLNNSRDYQVGGCVMDKRHEIEKLAYEFFQRDGCVHGLEFEHWIEAERIVHTRYEILPAEKPAKVKKPVATKGASLKGTGKERKTARKAPAKGKTKKAGNS
jgi:hypothetical protein